MKKINPDNSEETKLCPYCMGELALDAVKCSHCGELVEEKKKRRNRLRREDRETAEREVRRTLQDKTREKMKSDKSVKPKSTQKGVSESKGIKSWWAAQTGVSKGTLVLFAGLVLFGGIYLVAGSNQDIPGTESVDQILPTTTDLPDTTEPSSGKSTSVKACTVCGGDGKVKCSNCNGIGEIEVKITCGHCGGDGEGPEMYIKNGELIPIPCNKCNGTGVSSINYEPCNICEKTGYVKCTNCGGDGKIE